MTAADVLGESIVASLPESMRRVRPERVVVHQAPLAMTLVWGRTTSAITLGSHLFVDADILGSVGPRLQKLVIHELVHVSQWTRQRPISFLVEYVGQYLLSRLRGAGHHVAYMSIGAEVEARRMTSQLAFLLDDH